MLQLIVLLVMLQLPQKESNLCAKTAEDLHQKDCSEEVTTNVSENGFDYVCTWVCVGREPTKWELDSVTIKRKKKLLPPEVWHADNAVVFINRRAAIEFGVAWEKEIRDGLKDCASTVRSLPRSCPKGRANEWLSVENGRIFVTRPKKYATCDWVCQPKSMDSPESFWGIRAGPWSLESMGYSSEQP